MRVIAILFGTFFGLSLLVNSQVAPVQSATSCAPANISGYKRVRCPPGWVPYNREKCFKFFNARIGQADAQLNCRKHGSDLPSIHSVQEWEFLRMLVQSEIPKIDDFWGTWIGIMKRGNLWFSVDLSPVDYTNWFHGSPGTDVELCVFLETYVSLVNNSADFGKMVTRECSSPLNYMCQMSQLDAARIVYLP